MLYTECTGKNEHRFKENLAAVRMGVLAGLEYGGFGPFRAVLFGCAFGCLVLYRRALSFLVRWASPIRP